jgi:hypothetical protein
MSMPALRIKAPALRRRQAPFSHSTIEKIEEEVSWLMQGHSEYILKFCG